MLAKAFKPRLVGQNVGVLLPSSAAGSLANFALLLEGKTVVNLNYSAGQEAFLSALDKAEISSIVTSKKFLQKLKLKGFDLSTALENTDLIFLEDVKANSSVINENNCRCHVRSITEQGSEITFCKARGCFRNSRHFIFEWQRGFTQGDLPEPRKHSV